MTQPFYASSAINRHGDYRNNDKLLNSITTEKNTKFVPYYNGKNLFMNINENINPIIFNQRHYNITLTHFINISTNTLIIYLIFNYLIHLVY